MALNRRIVLDDAEINSLPDPAPVPSNRTVKFGNQTYTMEEVYALQQAAKDVVSQLQSSSETQSIDRIRTIQQLVSNGMLSTNEARKLILGNEDFHKIQQARIDLTEEHAALSPPLKVGIDWSKLNDEEHDQLVEAIDSGLPVDLTKLSEAMERTGPAPTKFPESKSVPLSKSFIQEVEAKISKGMEKLDPTAMGFADFADWLETGKSRTEPK